LNVDFRALAHSARLIPKHPSTSTAARTQHKNWEGITTGILSGEKEKTTTRIPNVEETLPLTDFFQKIFGMLTKIRSGR